MATLHDLYGLLPECILSATVLLLIALAAVMRGAVKRCCENRIVLLISLIGLISAFIFSILPAWRMDGSYFSNLITIDSQTAFFRCIIIATAIIAVIMSARAKELSTLDRPEYFALMIGSSIGMTLLSATSNILMIYLAMETMGLLSYMLVGSIRGDRKSAEAAMKYLFFGAISSAIFLFGASLFYGATSSLDIAAASSALPESLIIPSFMMLLGFLFKVAAFPMQAWCPDAYEGAPIPIAAFLSVASKAAGVAVIIRISSIMGESNGWPLIIAIISAITMTVGNLSAIHQRSIKRLLAYSSIANAGYILMAIAASSGRGYEGALAFIIALFIMDMGAFTVLQVVSNRFGTDKLEAFDGLAKCGGFGAMISVAMAIFLLSLVGLPPFIGFVGKLYIFTAAVDSKLYWLALVGVINSVISLYYYMRIVKAMFLKDVASNFLFKMESRALTAMIAILAILTVTFGLAWGLITKIVSA